MRTPAHTTASVATVPDAPRDHRGSPIPTVAMIATRFMELRKRRGLLIALILVNIGIPTVFLVVRLLAHAIAPKSYGPAGGYDIYTGLCTGVLYVLASSSPRPWAARRVRSTSPRGCSGTWS